MSRGYLHLFVCFVAATTKALWLGKIASKMRSGTRLALVEIREGELPQGPPEGMKIPKAELLSLITGAGFSLESDLVDLLPYQSFLIFRRL